MIARQASNINVEEQWGYTIYNDYKEIQITLLLLVDELQELLLRLGEKKDKLSWIDWCVEGCSVYSSWETIIL